MNLAFFTRFSASRKTNAILRWITAMRKHPVFKGARFDVYTPTLEPDRLIILLGQMHTVWKGKIANRARKKIVRCQAQLCSYYVYLNRVNGLRSFGGEGMYEGMDISGTHQACFQLYQQTAQALGNQGTEDIAKKSEKMLWELGKQWQRELRSQQHPEKVRLLAAAVSGQALFDFLTDDQTHVYPIEGERAYQHVLQNINHLGERIAKMENSYEMRVVRQNGGKAQDEQQAEVVKQYNALIKEFNRIIGSDIRERATMEILREKAETAPLVVFTMGVGHRKNYLQLINEYLKNSKTAFVFITPPALLPNWWIIIGVPLLILIILLGLNGLLPGLTY